MNIKYVMLVISFCFVAHAQARNEPLNTAIARENIELVKNMLTQNKQLTKNDIQNAIDVSDKITKAANRLPTSSSLKNATLNDQKKIKKLLVDALQKTKKN